MQTEVKRLGGEPDAPTSSNGGGLKSMIAGKDDAAVLDVLEREIVETLREYHNAKTEILRVRSDNTDLAYELLDKHVKRLEEARKELKDLSIMLDCM